MDQDTKTDIQPDIEELQQALSDMENNWKRAVADYRNLEKRQQDERLSFIQFANETLLRRLLPVIDNMESLEKFSDDQGLKLVIKDFRQILRDSGLEEVDIKPGDEFTTESMEAVDMENNEATNDNEKIIVKEIYKKAYKLNNKLIRPATVKAGYQERN